MTEEELRQEIRRLAVDGKAACRALLELAARAGEKPGRVGGLCDEMRIKVAGCQLGCFR